MKDSFNPLTVIETISHFNDWSYALLCETEAVVIVPVEKREYEIHFIWQQETSYLHLICLSEVELQDKEPSLSFLHFLMMANQKIWVGSLSLLENNIVAYRHVLHLKETSYSDLESLVDEIMAIAVETSETYMPGLQQTLKAENTFSAAEIDLLSLDVEGCA